APETPGEEPGRPGRRLPVRLGPRQDGARAGGDTPLRARHLAGPLGPGPRRCDPEPGQFVSGDGRIHEGRRGPAGRRRALPAEPGHAGVPRDGPPQPGRTRAGDGGPAPQPRRDQLRPGDRLLRRSALLLRQPPGRDLI
ncbi:MAG: hypothetical protein AVDCRST_MAG05-3075, partial [uncultured Rubrobacteraceae bacterium]